MRNDALTAIRGLAAFTVFVSHAANAGMLPRQLGGGLGQIGVMLFFALSGFLMTALYAGQPFRWTSLRSFAVARVGRVFPLYFLVLFVSVVMTWIAPQGWHYLFTEAREILLAALFVAAPYELWSIPVEVQYYVVFVAIWWGISRLSQWRHQLAGLLALAFINIAIMAVLAFNGWRGDLLPFYGSYFLLGGIIAIVSSNVPIDRLIAERWQNYIATAAIVLYLINIPLIRQSLGLSYGGFMLRTWFDPVNMISIALMIFCAAYRMKPFVRLSVWPLLFMGEISYGFYLMHRPILEYVDAGVDPQYGFVLALIITVLLAWLSLRWFEQPVARYLRQKLVDSRRVVPKENVSAIREGA